MCVKNCSSVHPFSENRICVDKCSTSYYENTPAEAQRYKCVSSCSTFSFINQSVQNGGDRYQCVDKCPSEVPYSDNKKCVRECSSQKYDNKDLSCKNKCSSVFVQSGNNRVCYDACPDEGQRVEVADANQEN